MKKNTVINLCSLFVITCAVIALAGCADICEDKNGQECSGGTTNISYTSSVAPEKLCTLNILGTLTVKKFDGEDVNWSAGFGNSWSSVRISEGSHTFVIDYRKAPMFGTPYGKNGIIFSHDNFVAGHTYNMMVKSGYSGGELSGGIWVQDVTQGRK